MLSYEDYVGQVQALHRLMVRDQGLTDPQEICDLANDLLCCYGSANDMPFIAVAYVASDSEIKVDRLSPYSVRRRTPQGEVEGLHHHLGGEAGTAH